MHKRVTIRHAEQEDIGEILGLVRDVVQEKYGHLFSGEPPIPTDADIRLQSWVAFADGSVVGVGLAEGDYIDDLWLCQEYRGQKIGSALLSMLESKIEGNGHLRARLRVVAENAGARRFYARQGWRETKVYPHERDGHLMVDMHKDLDNGS